MEFGEKVVNAFAHLLLGVSEIFEQTEYCLSVFSNVAKIIAKLIIVPLSPHIAILRVKFPVFNEETLREAAKKNKILAAIVITF